MKPSWQLVSVGVTLIVLTVFRSTYGQQLIDDDTVGISAFEDIGPPPPFEDVRKIHRVKRETLTGPDGTTVTINCKTVRNQEGHCRPFKSCYPVLLRDEVGDDFERRNGNSQKFELELMYRNVSGPCSEQMLSAIAKVTIGKDIKKEEYVCCPDGNDLVYKPTSKPNRPSRPPASTVTVNDNSCGRSFTGRSSEDHLDNNTSVEEYDEFTTTESQLIEGGVVPEFLIVNGRQTNRGEFPWNVALMNNGRQFCGGSLISNNHILTAAHCIAFMNQNDVRRLTINIGDHNVYSTSDGAHQVRKASNIYYHRGFSMKTLYDDVSVIRLSQPVTFGKYIQPVCLSSGRPSYDSGNTHADVTGWGKTSAQGPQASTLRVVTVRVLTQNECINRYKGKSPTKITSAMVCAFSNGKDSCQGDSGGPLTINSHSRATQIGVVSWGIGCATYPGVYTRVDQYLPWINKNRR